MNRTCRAATSAHLVHITELMEIQGASLCRNPNAVVAVLGKFDPPAGEESYIQMANRLNANYYSISVKLYEKLGETNARILNQAFLDRLIQRGDLIRFSRDPTGEYGTTLAWEVNHLYKNGYVLAQDSVTFLMRKIG